jgi:hypothetical protein
MDNIKTKLQTQTTTSTCEKLDNFLNTTKKNNNLQKNKIINASTFSTNSKPDCTGEPPIKYKNILSTVKYIYRDDGFFKGFFKGLSPRILSNAPSCAISWGTYEIIKNLLLTNK